MTPGGDTAGTGKKGWGGGSCLRLSTPGSSGPHPHGGPWGKPGGSRPLPQTKAWEQKVAPGGEASPGQGGRGGVRGYLFNPRGRWKGERKLHFKASRPLSAPGSPPSAQAFLAQGRAGGSGYTAAPSPRPLPGGPGPFPQTSSWGGGGTRGKGKMQLGMGQSGPIARSPGSALFWGAEGGGPGCATGLGVAVHGHTMRFPVFWGFGWTKSIPLPPPQGSWSRRGG